MDRGALLFPYIIYSAYRLSALLNGLCINSGVLCISIKATNSCICRYNPSPEAKNHCFICVNSLLLRLRKVSQRARILPVRQKTNCKTQTTIFAKSTVSGLQVPSPSGTRVAKTPHIACRDSFRKPGPSYPALFFPCSPARDRFALRRRSLLPKAFAPAATWTRLCLRSSRTGGWLHSRYRETSASPYQKEGTITRPRSEHLIFLSGGRSGRQLRDSRTYAMVLGDLRRCKTAFYRTGHRATIYGAGAVMRRRTTILYRTSAAIFTR